MKHGCGLHAHTGSMYIVFKSTAFTPKAPAITFLQRSLALPDIRLSRARRVFLMPLLQACHLDAVLQIVLHRIFFKVVRSRSAFHGRHSRSHLHRYLLCFLGFLYFSVNLSHLIVRGLNEISFMIDSEIWDFWIKVNPEPRVAVEVLR